MQEIIRLDLGGVNCYLLKKEKQFLLVDTGGHMLLDKVFTNRREILLESLKKEGCMPGDLKLVILTHGDNDHAGNAAYLKEHYNVKIAMHAGDQELVTDLDWAKMEESFNFRSLVNRIVFKLLRKKIGKLYVDIIADFTDFKPDILLEEGTDLAEYGFAAKILHLPGHTKGSIGILVNENGLIAGDTLKFVKKPEPALNATDFVMLNKSIERIKGMGIKNIYPGHGQPFIL